MARKSREAASDIRDRVFDCIRRTAALSSACIDRHRNSEIEVLAESVEAGMHFRQACAAFEYQVDATMAGEVVEQNGAEIILFDDLAREAGRGGREGNRLTKQRDIFVKSQASVGTVSH
ncbi:MAG: hypothetical protein WCQ77_16290 [Planctomycetota bacterium]